MLTIAFDTSTKNLSVALYKDAELILAKDYEGEGYVHSEKLLPFLKEIVESSGNQLSDLSRVFLGLGPGSYTGLRIGAATAKALGFGLDIPVFGISSNEILFWSAKEEAEKEGMDYVATMIDARRDEVYYQLFDVQGKPMKEIESLVIDQPFIDELKEKKILFCGDGAIKFKGRFDFFQSKISESTIINKVDRLAERLKLLTDSDTLDLAYFDAQYVKPYQPGKKKSIFS